MDDGQCSGARATIGYQFVAISYCSTGGVLFRSSIAFLVSALRYSDIPLPPPSLNFSPRADQS